MRNTGTSVKPSWQLYIIPLLAVIALLYATRFGAGISPDSVFYISAAQSLGDTGELRSIYEGSEWAYLSHYPPGYSVLIATYNFFTHDLYEAARWVSVTFLFALLLAIGYMLRPFLSTAFLVITQVLIVCNLSVFKIYEMSWSEPPFLFLSMVGLYALYRFAKGRKVSWLIASGLLISMAVSVRYVGVTLIIASVIYLWISLKNEAIGKRIGLIALHGFLSCLLLAGWMVRNMILIKGATDRKAAFHPMTAEYYKDWISNTQDFFLPVAGNGSLLSYTIGGFFLAAFTIFTIRRIRTGTEELSKLLLIYAAVYLLFLIVSNTFFDFTPLYHRTLTPAYLILLLALMIYLFGNNAGRSGLKKVFILVLLFVHVPRFIRHLKQADDGIEYSSKSIRIPSTIAGIRSLPETARMFSNEVDRIYYLTGRSSDWFRDLESAKQEDAYLVWFKSGRLLDSIPNTETTDWSTFLETEDLLIRKHK